MEIEIPLEYILAALALIGVMVWVFTKHIQALVLAIVAAYILLIYLLGSRLELGSLWYFITIIGGALLLRYIVDHYKKKTKREE